MMLLLQKFVRILAHERMDNLASFSKQNKSNVRKCFFMGREGRQIDQKEGLGHPPGPRCSLFPVDPKRPALLGGSASSARAASRPPPPPTSENLPPRTPPPPPPPPTPPRPSSAKGGRERDLFLGRGGSSQISRTAPPSLASRPWRRAPRPPRRRPPRYPPPASRASGLTPRRSSPPRAVVKTRGRAFPLSAKCET
jgi:hypothetical protein